jgi:hypothetical protein
MKKESEKEHDFKKAKVNRENGLNISYDQEELKTFLPHLLEEIKGREESVKIDGVDYEVEQSEAESQKESGRKPSNLEELRNPKAIDFIRRCSTRKEAREILDYLLKREEISEEKASSIKKKLKKENGLEELIEKSGGFKKPGYYMRKYYMQTTEMKEDSESSDQQK